MSGLEVFGAVGTVLDIVGRAINAVNTIRDLHRLSQTNPAQCDRLWASLRKLRSYLEEKASLQEMEAACLGHFWLHALVQVRAALLESAVDLEEAAGTGTGKRARLLEFGAIRRAGRVKHVLDDVEKKAVFWWERLCSYDSAVRSVEQTRQVLGAVRAGGEETVQVLQREVESVAIESRRGAEVVAEKVEGVGMELRGEIGAVGRRGDEVLGVVQGNGAALVECQREIAGVRHMLSSVLTPEILAGLARLQCDPPACYDAVRKVVSQTDDELSTERMSGIVFEALTPGSSVADFAGSTASTDEDTLDEEERYERDRDAFRELQPKAAAFLSQLEAGKIGTRLSEQEKNVVHLIFDKLWKPWEVDATGLVFDVKKSGRQFQIGAGSYGSVFRASWDKTGDVKVAVKVLYGQLARGEDFRAEFCREASLLYRLRHPSIAQFYGARWPKDVLAHSRRNGLTDFQVGSDSEEDEEEEEDAFLVMELMDGDAGALLEKGGKLTQREDVVRVLLHIAEALDYIHRQHVLHLDIKPENILLRVRNRRLVGRAKLTDFGISREKRRQATATQTARFSTGGGSTAGRGGIGTAAYMAPELLIGSFGRPSSDSKEKKLKSGRVSSACDVYSFGVTICTLMHLLNNRGKKVPSRFCRSEGELAVAAFTGELCLETRDWVDEVLAGDGLQHIALACVEIQISCRPTMAFVAKALRCLVCDGPDDEAGSALSVRAALVGVDASNCDELYQFGQKEFVADGDNFNLKRGVAIMEKAAQSGSSAALSNVGFLFEHGFGVTKDLAKAAELYESAGAWRNLAVLTLYGLGVRKDEKKARDLLDRASAVEDSDSHVSAWSNLCYMVEDSLFDFDSSTDMNMHVTLLARAVENGSSSGGNKLGILFLRGAGVQKNCSKAVQLFEEAVSSGSTYACLNLGVCHARGCGYLKINPVKSVELYQKAVESGCVDASNYLAVMYRDGNGVPVDEEKAWDLLTFAGNRGCVDALVNLGQLYETGSGVHKDERRAVGLYQRAAEARNVNGMYHLAWLYENGIGVDRKDERKAAEYYKDAADGGKVSAVLNLGILAECGRGVEKNPARAAELYSFAAEKGNSAAMVRLGRLLETGVGLVKDEKRAVELFQAAAWLSDGSALNSLALAYWYGKGGLTRNCAKAEQFFEKAIRVGYADAKINLNRLRAARVGP